MESDVSEWWDSCPKAMVDKAVAELGLLTVEQKKFDIEKWHDSYFKRKIWILMY